MIKQYLKNDNSLHLALEGWNDHLIAVKLKENIKITLGESKNGFFL